MNIFLFEIVIINIYVRACTYNNNLFTINQLLKIYLKNEENEMGML